MISNTPHIQIHPIQTLNSGKLPVANRSLQSVEQKIMQLNWLKNSMRTNTFYLEDRRKQIGQNPLYSVEEKNPHG